MIGPPIEGRPRSVGKTPTPVPVSSGSTVKRWLDQRTGYSEWVALIAEQPISGGARWWYVFGTVLLFLLCLEFATGLLLASVYAPSVSSAWASTAFVQDTLTMGWFIRGLHGFGSSALIALCVLHLLQVVIFGAYRAPREMTWLVGLAIFALVLVFSLTGYGLPWDEGGYWAKQTELAIIGAIPIIGTPLQIIIQGGQSLGHYTLTHLFSIHALALPALVAVLVLWHLRLVRRHGRTPRWNIDEAVLARQTEAYWPDQAARDAVACAITFALLAIIVVDTHGVKLDGPADPNSTFKARPEWYSLPLFQLRSLVGGTLELAVTVLVPGVCAILLAALPWLDRGRSRAPAHRWTAVAGTAAGMVGLVALGYMAAEHDRSDLSYQAFRAETERRAEFSRKLAQQGVPPEGGLAVFRNDRTYKTRELWREHCSHCHSFTGRGGTDGPDLNDYNSRAWIERFLRAPDGLMSMEGAKFQNGMKPVESSDEEIKALTEMVYAESGAPDVDRARAQRGLRLFSEKDCDACHDLDGTSINGGPNLKARGTLAYLVDFISDPADERFFGARNKMPRFVGKLTPDEIAELARFVLTESRK
jgi:ubiquinol-cytochrome c reductase cytochrome b subunit